MDIAAALIEAAKLQEETTARALDESAQWRRSMSSIGAAQTQKGRKGTELSPHTNSNWFPTLSPMVSIRRNPPNPHELPRSSVPPQIHGWTKKQYLRPSEKLQLELSSCYNRTLNGVCGPASTGNWRPASTDPSEWSDAWTATITKRRANNYDTDKETTYFIMNPGRNHICRCDVTSPRCVRWGFGLSNSEYFNIVEPIKPPPPSRETKLIKRHGSIDRRRGKHDCRTCQLGFDYVELQEKFARTRSVVDEREQNGAPREHTRITTLDLTRNSMRSGVHKRGQTPPTLAPQDMNIPGRHKRDCRWGDHIQYQNHYRGGGGGVA